MSDLLYLSKLISRRLAERFLIERTHQEIAEALLIMSDGVTARAIDSAAAHLADQVPMCYLVHRMSMIFAE